MTEPVNHNGGYSMRQSGASLADILDRVLDKGIVIAGDVTVNLLDIELLTLKLRLLIASVDKAREMGIDWWEWDPRLSRAARDEQQTPRELPEPIDLQQRLDQLEGQMQRILARLEHTRTDTANSAAEDT